MWSPSFGLQAAAFQLPLAQLETAGWWAPLLTIPRLHLAGYMHSPTSSYFWIMRKQKTMALAGALQACTEMSGFPSRVLCDAVWELQRCMALLLAFNSNEIVEAFLLRPVGGEHRPSPTPEEETTLLGDIKCKIKCRLNCPKSQSS